RKRDTGPGKKSIRIGQKIRSSWSVFASFIPARLSRRETSANAHRDCARRGVGRLGRCRSGTKNFWQTRRLQGARARRGRNQRTHGACPRFPWGQRYSRKQSVDGSRRRAGGGGRQQ